MFEFLCEILLATVLLEGLFLIGFCIFLRMKELEMLKDSLKEQKQILRADDHAETFEDWKERMSLKTCPSLSQIWVSLFDPAQIGEPMKNRIGLHCGNCKPCGTIYDLLLKTGKERYLRQVKAEGFRALKFGDRR